MKDRQTTQSEYPHTSTSDAPRTHATEEHLGEDLLWDLADGGLTPEEASVYRAHLDRCPDCMREYEKRKAQLKATGACVPPSDGRAVEAALSRITRETRAPRSKFPAYLRAMGGIAAALLLIVGLFRVVPLLNRMTPPEGHPQTPHTNETDLYGGGLLPPATVPGHAEATLPDSSDEPIQSGVGFAGDARADVSAPQDTGEEAEDEALLCITVSAVASETVSEVLNEAFGADALSTASDGTVTLICTDTVTAEAVSAALTKANISYSSPKATDTPARIRITFTP